LPEDLAKRDLIDVPIAEDEWVVGVHGYVQRKHGTLRAVNLIVARKIDPE
jgi:hypothetical protein